MGRKMSEDELIGFSSSVNWEAGMAQKRGDHEAEKRHRWVMQKIERFIEHHHP